VEGAQTGVVLTAFFQGNAVADNIDNIGTVD
jgi:hypothetical protein